MKIPLLALALSCSFTAHAGIVIGGTRFVFPEAAESITVDMKNTTSADYLVQTKISSLEGKTIFVATPPLVMVEGGHAGKIRIIRTGGILPADRESLFYLTIAAIPAGRPDANSLQIAVKSRMKLFYRPAGLTKGADLAYQKVQWKMNDGVLQVSNPTPYYVTLSQLKIDEQPAEQNTMIAPFSALKVPGCHKNATCQVQWQSLNDYATLMPVRKISVAPSFQPSPRGEGEKQGK